MKFKFVSLGYSFTDGDVYLFCSMNIFNGSWYRFTWPKIVPIYGFDIISTLLRIETPSLDLTYPCQYGEDHQ